MSGITSPWRFRARQGALRRLCYDDSDNLRPEAQTVCAMLRDFCHVLEPTTMVSPQTGMVDPLAMAQAEGRREVFNLLQFYLHANAEAIFGAREPLEPTDAA